MKRRIITFLERLRQILAVMVSYLVKIGAMDALAFKKQCPFSLDFFIDPT